MQRSFLLAAVTGLFFVSGSGAQYPMMDALAGKVVQKYQQASCEDLAAKKGQPRSAQEQSHPDAAQRSSEASRIHR
jgi:hypothetical protein